MSLHELEVRAGQLWGLLRSCRLCAHECAIDRTGGQTGVCRATEELRIASYGAHFGEEPFLSGERGAGTIFFTGCNARCVYCQNYQISQEDLGEQWSVDDLAAHMLALQEEGCHNLDLVTPTHYAPHVVQALAEGRRHGLELPIVYNTNTFDSLDMLRLLDGIVDIYLPDSKYASDQLAVKYSGLPEYSRHSREAMREMFRQVGNLVVDDDGIAVKGMIVRHLVLPGDISGSYDTLDFLYSLSPELQIGIMSQYNPVYHAQQYSPLNRRVTWEEYRAVVAYAENKGFENILIQEMDSPDHYLPDFSREKPFER